MKRLFIGPNGLRAGWRLLLFVAGLLVIQEILVLAVQAAHLRLGDEWSPKLFVLSDGITFAACVFLAWLFGRFERRTLADYGFPLRDAFGARFWEGVLWGGALVSILVFIVWRAGGMSFHGFHLHGATLAEYFGAWLVATLFIGLAEEVMFRGYPFVTLIDGLGFWPAAIAMSLIFGAMHFFLKPGENLADAASVTLLGLFMAWTLLRTGSLWFAIGFHAMFDFAALAFYGAPNSGNNGQQLPMRLLETSYHGPQWLTGGGLGLEASWVIFPLLAATWYAFHRRFPEKLFVVRRSLETKATTSSESVTFEAPRSN
jgi:membrane protease YdiL (CAAX protease family)